MPREPRTILSKSYYHIMTRGNNKNVIFKEQDDFYFYLKLLERFKKEHPFNLYHYCLMPNHTHFLIKILEKSDFPVFMKKINLAYFQYFKNKYGWVGSFWQGRYKSQVVGKDSYFIQCGKYIELNPVRKGLVERPEDYSFSSYNYYLKSEDNPLLTEDFFYSEMGKSEKERQENYEKIVIADVIKNSYKKIVWGGDIQRYGESRKVKRKFKNKKN